MSSRHHFDYYHVAMTVTAAFIGGGSGHASAQVGPIMLTTCGALGESRPYILAANLVAQGRGCLRLTADFVSVNLNGFAIIEGAPSSSLDARPAITDDGVALTGIVVRNGRIAGFFEGIDLAASSAVTIESMAFQGPGKRAANVGSQCRFSNNVFVLPTLSQGATLGEGCVAVGNTISLGAARIGLNGTPSGSVVARNILHIGEFEDGINFGGATGTVVAFNTITGHRDRGIAAATNALILGNTLRGGAGGGGFGIETSFSSLVVGNTLDRHKISVATNAFSLISGNSINNSSRRGIDADGVASLIVDNTVSMTTLDAIRVSQDNVAIVRNRISVTEAGYASKCDRGLGSAARENVAFGIAVGFRPTWDDCRNLGGNVGE